MNIDPDTEIQSAPAPQRGRPRTSARTAPPREPPRDPVRGDAVVAYGRDGEILSRKQTDVGDPFEITSDMKEHGWDMQWNTVSVYNNKDVCMQQGLKMYANGWRPVMSDRFPGRFMPNGHKGPIEMDGMRLEERPQALSDEARWHELQKAKQQMSDRNEALKLAGMKDSLPHGINPLTGHQRRFLKTGGDNVRMSIDHALDADIPRPSHELAGPGE
jgi:hypothetical protein